MWSIEENSSIRFLVDAIRLSRSPTTVIIVEDPDPTKPAPTVTRPSTQQHPQTESDRVISNVNRRIAAREEMLETVGKRNDVPFLLGLAAGLVVPSWNKCVI
uniref:Uncharacterized protein n=2 Tax=Lotharella globosa TaxID=91324 RepID=A0A7S3YZT0_9EUKA|mmetsp:Transcript_14923/g.30245  ORF Transcript_14923/g.30245 Transcript_14923/m.30245 type:complete len:102 (-) Transcript_14923:501-806(-)